MALHLLRCERPDAVLRAPSLSSLRFSAAIVCFLTVSACTTVQVAPPAPIRITLVGTNDVHGWVATQHEKLPQGDLAHGGASIFAGYLRILRAENPDGVILLDAGDLFQGTLMSNLTEGSVVIDVFNALGYSAAAIGNHEFDYGPVGDVSAVQPGLDAFGALKARIAQAKFPLLSANIFEVATKTRPAWLPGAGTAMITRHGIKIGIIGLTTPSTPATTLPINVASLEFRNLSATAIDAAKALRAQGAAVVIAAMHEGGRCSDNAHPLDLTSCDTDTGEIFEVLRQMPPGTLDAVVAGHTHAYVAHIVNGTAVIESGNQGRSFGLVELTIDPATSKVSTTKIELHDICGTADKASMGCEVKKHQARGADATLAPAVFHGQPVIADAAIDALLDKARAAAEQQQRPLGLTVPVTLTRDAEEESTLGSFIADSLRAINHADVGVINSGSLRADLKAGPLFYGAVYEVTPFDNTLAMLEVTGEQLTSLLRTAYAAKKGMFQISGLEVKLARCPKANQLRELTLGGKPLDAKRLYRVAMPDYLARGGGGFASVLKVIDPKRFDLGENRNAKLRDELVTLWQSQKATFEAPKLGRITFVSEPGVCADP